MKAALYAWVGMADLRSLDTGIPEGPIYQALMDLRPPVLHLISDHGKTRTRSYANLLLSAHQCDQEIHFTKLSSPTDFGDIYTCARSVLERSTSEDLERVYHLSPGTPAMAAVWIILAKSRFPARLIESSREHGVKTVSLPFDISADFLPDLITSTDESLVRMSQGLPPESPEFDAIVHRSAVMKKVIARARRVAARNLPVLILGESGTGKELFARAIHTSSQHPEGPFVPVNCGAIPSELVESELFGHERGAFTGANKARKGYIEEASEGTLFLDEVGELPLAAQVKLLRVLQDQAVTPIGGRSERSVRFRLIAATNRDLYQEATHGRFREDLFHRIAVAILEIPPLRDREGDLNLLIDYTLRLINDESRGRPENKHKEISVSAKKLLQVHDWPGNVRELINTLQRACLWSEGDILSPNDIRDALLVSERDTHETILGRPLTDSFSLPRTMEVVATHYLERAIEESGGNKSRAAELLGLPSYQTLTNWLKRYGVDHP